ncbi:MAG TPA: aminotransferase class I/II-fold pyridoxal phosphate-dependent enzyme [Vicinamibacterales bacterium]|nr:aminotransferase class I/II-fold pyridoxal phosphate-dependent enzyme [Vicinamibacterales bacterium]
MNVRARYMEWAKARPPAAIDLALSNVLACSVGDLEHASAALDLSGHNDNGFPPLLEAIAARYGAPPDMVATATGTSGANFLAALAVLEPGDEVLVESPAYDPLLAVPRALGARVLRFERRFEERYAIDPDRIRRAMTSSTRLVIVTHPHNPSGALTSDAALAAIAAAAAERRATLLVDEVYLDAARGCGARPAALLADNVISTNSLTKSYGLASLRCGWALASGPLAERIRRARDVVDGTGSIPAERLSVIAFDQLDRLADRARRILEPNVAAFRAFLSRTPQLDGFAELSTVAFPRLRSGADAEELATRLLRDFQTAIVPGLFFEAPAHFRIGLGIAPDILQQGLPALSKALSDRGD